MNTEIIFITLTRVVSSELLKLSWDFDLLPGRLRPIHVSEIKDKSSWDTPKKICFLERVSFSIFKFRLSTPSPLFSVVTTWPCPWTVSQRWKGGEGRLAIDQKVGFEFAEGCRWKAFVFLIVSAVLSMSADIFESTPFSFRIRLPSTRIRWMRQRIRMFLPHVDGEIFESKKKKLRIQKYLDTCGRAPGPGQTRYFTWTESNVNEENPLFSLVSIRFGSFEVRRLNSA